MGELARRDDGLIVSDDKALLDVDRIAAWLAASYWANERDRATIERSIANSYAVGVYTPSGEQVALARATTDYASFAWIGDVVVDDDWRGKGIGTWLMRTLVDELRSRGVPRFVLVRVTRTASTRRWVSVRCGSSTCGWRSTTVATVRTPRM